MKKNVIQKAALLVSAAMLLGSCSGGGVGLAGALDCQDVRKSLNAFRDHADELGLDGAGWEARAEITRRDYDRALLGASMDHFEVFVPLLENAGMIDSQEAEDLSALISILQREASGERVDPSDPDAKRLEEKYDDPAEVLKKSREKIANINPNTVLKLYLNTVADLAVACPEESGSSK